MSIANLKGLAAFVVVAEERSFTRAAARLQISQSALSQTIRLLESELALRLFTRTTRSVALTEEGKKVLKLIGPAMSELSISLTHIGEIRDSPTGTLRITADEYAVQKVLAPALPGFLAEYPHVQVEITTDYGREDIVAQRFDAGIRRGGLVARDMIAVPVSSEIPMAVVGSPSYFEHHLPPLKPADLRQHNCIQLKLPTHGEQFAWLFDDGMTEYKEKVSGSFVFNSISPIRDMAVAGTGLAYLPVDYVKQYIEAGQLIEVLSDLRKTFEGYYIYYANRHHSGSALSLLVNALRYRELSG